MSAQEKIDTLELSGSKIINLPDGTEIRITAGEDDGEMFRYAVEVTQGARRISIEPYVEHICWDGESGHSAKLVDELSGEELKKLLPRGMFVLFDEFGSQGGRVVGFEVN